MNRLLKRISIIILCICLVRGGIRINAAEASDTTIIDCTDLFTGDVISHDCSLYLGTNYNGSNHWDECSICHKKFNIAAHSYSQYWTMGNSCSPNNKLRHTCSCGYSYDTNNTRNHPSSQWNMDAGGHNITCSVCSTILSNNGPHYNSRGQLIGCRTGIAGICAVCGQNTTTNNHTIYQNYYFTNNTYVYTGCSGCGTNPFYALSGSISYTGNYFYIVLYDTYNGAYGNITDFYAYNPSFPVTTTGVITGFNSYLNENTIVYAVSGYSCNNDLTDTWLQGGIRISTSSGHVFYSTFSSLFKPELIAPTINNIQEEDLSVDGDWVTAKQLTISGTENYCGTVRLNMSDSMGNKYLNNVSVKVNGGQWSYKFIPEIEADEQGLEFTITATDSLGNQSSKKIIFYNTDKKPPTLVSEKETTKEWSRTKDIVIDTTDFGARDVFIAFNDTDDYQLAERNENNFTRPYTMTGDVYGSTVAAVYAKDGLGNTRTEFITIHNLDNTAPTVTKAVSERQGIRNAVVTVAANDINTKLNASGSGVAGYAITQNTEQVPDAFQTGNTFNLTKSGTWYVWAVDAVGNISEPVPVDVKIEYTVSLDANGGTLTGDSSYQIISGETVTIPEPVREGYTFIGWTVDGTGSSVNGNDFTMGSEDADIIANWQINQYEVDYIDAVDSTSGKHLGSTKKLIDYNSQVRGSDIGNNTADNAYYNGYYYVSDTVDIVTINGATVYRIFALRTVDVSGTVSWNDNSNKHGTRPDSVTVTLYRDGEAIDTWTGLVNENSNAYTFPDLPKYSTEDGHMYDYTVVQGDVTSKYAPEDKYVASQSGYDIINTLTNVLPDDPEEGLSAKGIIYWEDAGDKLGFRPSTVKISLYQNGIFYKEIEIDTAENIYEFPKLPKYDENLEKYEYTVKETINAIYALSDGTIINAYDIVPDMPNDLDFTNVIHVVNEPVYPVKPEHINEITVKTNTVDKVSISLKGKEYYINDNLSVTYGEDYNGCEYNIVADNLGTAIKDIPCGKYEIYVNDIDYGLSDIILTDSEHVSLVYEDGHYYLIIEDVPGDTSGVITLDLSKKDRGYSSKESRNNYFAVHMQAAIAALKDYAVIKMSDVVITAQDIYTITYVNSNTEDTKLYMTGEEITVLDYLGMIPENKEFAGWATTDNAAGAEYCPGDIISVGNENVVLYPVFEEKQLNMETAAETEDNSECLEESPDITAVE